MEAEEREKKRPKTSAPFSAGPRRSPGTGDSGSQSLKAKKATGAEEISSKNLAFLSSSTKYGLAVRDTLLKMPLSRKNSDERRPLLEDRDRDEADDTVERVTPLPKLQLALLFFIRATDPICFNVIFPFINQMLLDVGGVSDPKQVGYRAGLVSSPGDKVLTNRSNRCFR